MSVLTTRDTFRIFLIVVSGALFAHAIMNVIEASIPPPFPIAVVVDARDELDDD